MSDSTNAESVAHLRCCLAHLEEARHAAQYAFEETFTEPVVTAAHGALVAVADAEKSVRALLLPLLPCSQ